MKSIFFTRRSHSVVGTISLLFLSLFAEADSWTQKADFGGTPRNGTFQFSIGNKGYIGAGVDNTGYERKDFWEYDPSLNTWSQKADYAGGINCCGIGFSILNKGYAGLGDSAGMHSNLFYEYDPSINTWTAKSNYPSSNVVYPVTFSINNLGYVCTGATNSAALWQYNPGLDIWTQKNNLPGVARVEALGFSIGSKGYVGAGVSSVLLNDFWEYNSSTDTWSQKANTPGGVRCDAAAFSLCDKGYIAVGEGPTIGSFFNDVWEYDTTANQWTQKATFIGGTRDEIAFLTIGDKAYIGLGGHTSASYKDFYEYTPDSCNSSSEDINELFSSAFQFQVSPNPAHDELRLTPNPLSKGEGANSRYEIYIMDVFGKKVFSSYYELRTTNSELIDISGFSEGLYFIVADDGRERAVSKFVKE